MPAFGIDGRHSAGMPAAATVAGAGSPTATHTHASNRITADGFAIRCNALCNAGRFIREGAYTDTAAAVRKRDPWFQRPLSRFFSASFVTRDLLIPIVAPQAFLHGSKAMRRDNGALQDGTLGAMLLATVGLGLASTASPQDSNSIAALTTAVIAGTDGPDDLIGTLGDDTINGRGNADVMTGLAGNDTYIVDDEADEVVEQADEGTDTVRVFGTFLLPANVENLVLAGIQDGSGIGNSLDNRVIGNTGYNTLDGGPGNDTLTGRAGPDIFRFATTLSGTTNVDRVTDFNVVEDRIALHYPAFRAFVFSDGGL